MKWCFPPFTGYSSRCLAVPCLGLCATSPRPCVSGTEGMNSHNAANVKEVRKLYIDLQLS